jgi:transposase
MKPYSKNLRLRVLSAVDSGEPREELAKTFSVSVPTIKRWLKKRRETGDVEPEAIPGRPARKGAMLKGWLPEHLQANDDLTLEKSTARLSRSTSRRKSPPPPSAGP